MHSYIGMLIRKKRLENNYSQEGLCKGICAVSYLSKIENGSVQPSAEILRALFARLDIHDGEAEDMLLLRQELTTFLYEHDLMDEAYVKKHFAYLKQHEDKLLNSISFLDMLLVLALFDEERKQMALAQLHPYADCMSHQQREYYISVKAMEDESLLPMLEAQATSLYVLMITAYLLQQHLEFEHAAQLYERIYQRACDMGYVHTMLHSRLMQGNCYSHTLHMDLMMNAYQAALRIGEALRDEVNVSMIYYNIGSCYLEIHQPQQAYHYLAKCTHRDMLYHHKLALYYEQIEETTVALQELEKGYACVSAENEIDTRILDLVKYRLEHPDHLNDKTYHAMVFAYFAELRKMKAFGFVLAHLPYVLEVLEHQRRYKECTALLKEFSLNGRGLAWNS